MQFSQSATKVFANKLSVYLLETALLLKLLSAGIMTFSLRVTTTTVQNIFLPCISQSFNEYRKQEKTELAHDSPATDLTETRHVSRNRLHYYNPVQKTLGHLSNFYCTCFHRYTCNAFSSFAAFFAPVPQTMFKYSSDR